jgi:hypothetical protein
MRFTSFLLLLVLASSSARSEAPADPLAKYRERALSLEVGFFTGARVTRAGQDAHPGYFGDDAEVVFDGSPAALADMETFRTLRITGTTLWAAGLALLVTDLVLLAVDQPALIDSDNNATPLFHGLLGSGVALGVVGGSLMQGANSYLSDAVQHYNTDLEGQLRRQSGSTLQLRLMVTHHF